MDKIEKILTLLWKRVLKQAFGQGNELQEEVMLLSNSFNNRLDDFIDTSDEEDVINRRQTRNATSPRLSGIGRNGVASHSERGDGMEDVNGDMSEVCFLD